MANLLARSPEFSITNLNAYNCACEAVAFYLQILLAAQLEGLQSTSLLWHAHTLLM